MKIRVKRKSGCLICGSPIIYESLSRPRVCTVCGKTFTSNGVCAADHFVCDYCHSSGIVTAIAHIRESSLGNPVLLLQEVLGLPGINLHGPEHHIIVPLVLLAAYKNCGGNIDIEKAFSEAVARGKNIPGGGCGFLGVCGSAGGAGIFVSIASGASPLNSESWKLPQLVVSRCLAKNAEIGGVRCCKRTSRIAVETASEFSAEFLGVSMDTEAPPCAFSKKNKQCLGSACPYFPK